MTKYRSFLKVLLVALPLAFLLLMLIGLFTWFLPESAKPAFSPLLTWMDSRCQLPDALSQPVTAQQLPPQYQALVGKAANPQATLPRHALEINEQQAQYAIEQLKQMTAWLTDLPEGCSAQLDRLQIPVMTSLTSNLKTLPFQQGAQWLKPLELLWPMLSQQAQLQLLGDMLRAVTVLPIDSAAMAQHMFWLNRHKALLQPQQLRQLATLMPRFYHSSGGIIYELASDLLMQQTLFPSAQSLSAQLQEWLEATGSEPHRHSLYMAALQAELQNFYLLDRALYDAAYQATGFMPVYLDYIDKLAVYRFGDAEITALFALDPAWLAKDVADGGKSAAWFYDKPTKIWPVIEKQIMPEQPAKTNPAQAMKALQRQALYRMKQVLHRYQTQQELLVDGHRQYFPAAVYLKLSGERPDLALQPYIDSWAIQAELKYLQQEVFKTAVQRQQILEWQKQYRLPLRIVAAD